MSSSPTNDAGSVRQILPFVVLAVLLVAGYLVWTSEAVQARYFLWQVRRGQEPGPYVRKLVNMGPAAGPYVCKQLEDCPERSLRWVIEILPQINYPEGLDCARRFRTHNSPEVRMAALLVYRNYGKTQTSDVSEVAPLLDDPVEQVRGYACSALGFITGVDIPAEPETWKKYLADHPELLLSEPAPTPPADEGGSSPDAAGESEDHLRRIAAGRCAGRGRGTKP